MKISTETINSAFGTANTAGKGAKTYVFYHPILERAFAYEEIEARYNRMSQMADPGISFDQALNLFDEAADDDSAELCDVQSRKDIHSSKQLARITVRAATLQHVAQSTLFSIWFEALDMTAEEAAAHLKVRQGMKKALYDTVLVSENPIYKNLRRYIRIMLPGLLQSPGNTLQAANIPHTDVTEAYVNQEFAGLTDTDAKLDTEIPYLFSRAVKPRNGKGKVIPAKHTYVKYGIEPTPPADTSKGYTFDEEQKNKTEIARIWNSRTPMTKLHIEAVDNLLRRIDINSPSAQIIWLNDNNMQVSPGRGTLKKWLTVEQIIREAKKLKPDANIKPKTVKKVLDTLEDMSRIRATIDYTDTLADPGDDRIRISTNVLSFTTYKATINGRSMTVLVFNNASIFAQYNERLQVENGQTRTLQLPNAYLRNPNIKHWTDRSAVLYRYLAQWVWSHTKGERYFKTIFEYMNDTDDRKQQQRTTEAVVEALNYYLTLPDCPVTAWKYWHGKDGEGIQLIRKGGKKPQDEETMQNVQKTLKALETRVKKLEE